MHLIEFVGEKMVPVPSQIEPGEHAKLWFTLDGDTPAASKRR